MASESLLMSYGFVVGAILISLLNQLKMEREMFSSSLRATVQLIAMGFVLEVVLAIEEPLYLFLILLFMSLILSIIS